MVDRRSGLRILLEGVVIVTSILLALAADTWLDRLQEREIERTYIDQLTTNFQALDQRVSGWLAKEEAQLGSAVDFLSFVDSDGPVPRPTTLTHLRSNQEDAGYRDVHGCPSVS